jgi:hypothetical protein
MVRSLPVPLAVITRVWPDPAWREALRDLWVTDAVGAVTGFLHDADPERGVALTGPDGQRVWIAPTAVLLRHPALLDDLDAWRASAAAQGVEQRTEQLRREVWHRPPGIGPGVRAVHDHAGGVFDEARFLHGRAARLGHPVRGGSVVCTVVEDGRTVEARVWIGDDFSGPVETGPLTWADRSGRELLPAEVGPVAWSEGMRMAAGLYAGRQSEVTGTVGSAA